MKETKSQMVSVAESIMSEAFDDETVVVNMDRGHYYALKGISARAWSVITQTSVEPHMLAARTGTEEEALEPFLKLLSQEGLISGHPNFGEAREPADCIAETPFAGTFERFTDVEGLLLLDPIHDFESGDWPTADRP